MPKMRALLCLAMLCLVAISYYTPSGLAIDAPKPSPAPAAAATGAEGEITLSVDTTALHSGGQVVVSGRTQPGKPVYLEVWNERTVRSVLFDDKPGPDGVRPYKLYLSHELPAFYHLYVPAAKKDVFATIKALGREYSFSDALKELGADVAYTVPARMGIEVYQTSLTASIIGSRGDLLPPLEARQALQRSKQLMKARFGKLDSLVSPTVDITPDGSFTATIRIPSDSAPGRYDIAAYSDTDTRSQPVVLENSISFPVLYMENAGTSINVVYPFLLTLAIGVFGVLMGAGGGFLLNPLLLLIWPGLPHTVVAGTVTPTILFSQASGIYSYTKIKFISWKLGVIMGLAMACGGFIGPKLTELITVTAYKAYFGWILLFLAALMFWQTTPAYLNKNKKEQAILKEFKRRAEETAKGKA